jgi:hypothetical protein
MWADIAIGVVIASVVVVCIIGVFFTDYGK